MVDVATFRPREVFDAAAAGYATASEDLWPEAAELLVELAGPASGDRALDLACGAGAVTMQLAERVGPTGSVGAVDLSPEMVDIAAARAGDRGLSQVSVAVGDMHDLTVPDGSVDVLTCGFGLCFARDVTTVARDWWRVVRAGGRLAVSTFGSAHLSPVYKVFVDALLRERFGDDVTMPWQRTERPDVLQDLLAAAGIPARITTAQWPIKVGGVDDVWRILMSTGGRQLATRLTEPQSARVQDACTRYIEREGLDCIAFDVVFAVACKAD